MKTEPRAQDLAGTQARAPLPACAVSPYFLVLVRVQVAGNVTESRTNLRACLAHNVILMEYLLSFLFWGQMGWTCLGTSCELVELNRAKLDQHV